MLRAAPATLIDWGSPEGIQRLERSQYKQDFFPLANHFESQKNTIYCGVASAVIVLNALKLGDASIPKDDSVLPKRARRYLRKGSDPRFHKYTQHTLFAVNGEHIKNEREVFGKPMNGQRDVGFQLHQLQQMLHAHGVEAALRIVTPDTRAQEIKRELITNLRTAGDYILVNYSRKTLQQPGGGHISPLGVYDRRSDSFLIMDVNPNRASWVWVPSDQLIAAMRTFDTIQNRGYLLVSLHSN